MVPLSDLLVRIRNDSTEGLMHSYIEIRNVLGEITFESNLGDH
jgi:hypothetical protein